jgi:hypothetical protein
VLYSWADLVTAGTLEPDESAQVTSGVAGALPVQ